MFRRHSRPDLPPHAREFVARIREARAKVGHELTLMQEAVATSMAGCDPRHEAWARDRLAAIEAALEREDQWSETEEWRIGTWFETRIAKAERGGTDWYEIAVECDRQRLGCMCPTLEKAFAFVHLYKAFIIDQFYSVGPPWADHRLYVG